MKIKDMLKVYLFLQAVLDFWSDSHTSLHSDEVLRRREGAIRRWQSDGKADGVLLISLI